VKGPEGAPCRGQGGQGFLGLGGNPVKRYLNEPRINQPTTVTKPAAHHRRRLENQRKDL